MDTKNTQLQKSINKFRKHFLPQEQIPKKHKVENHYPRTQKIQFNIYYHHHHILLITNFSTANTNTNTTYLLTFHQPLTLHTHTQQISATLLKQKLQNRLPNDLHTHIPLSNKFKSLTRRFPVGEQTINTTNQQIKTNKTIFTIRDRIDYL